MASLSFEIEHCDGTEFVLMPACAYNGNRFPVLKKGVSADVYTGGSIPRYAELYHGCAVFGIRWDRA